VYIGNAGILSKVESMKTKQILFIEPSGAISNIFSRFMSIPLLGPVYLATIAKNAGYHVSIFNENIAGRPVSGAELECVDLLCVSCITTTVERGKLIASQYRDARACAHRPSRVIIGGIHASMLPQDVAANFDQIVIGEAETILLDLIEGVLRDPVVLGERLMDLDSLPFPDYSLMGDFGKRRLRPVMTSRGCPFDCNFCSVTKMFGNEYRAQSPSRVLSEIMRLPPGTVFFVDDNFAVDMKRSNEIVDLMIAKGFRNKWTAQVRTNVTHRPEFVAKMKKAGCKVVYVGFESINPQTLKDMNKAQTVEDIKRSIRVFHDNCIDVHGMFILGNDADTKDMFSETARFSRETGIDFVQYSVLTPLPGTDIFDRLVQENRLLHRNWSYYDGLHVTFAPKQMTAKELQHGMLECFKDFYSYSNGVSDALDALAFGTKAVFKNLYTQAYPRSLYPSFIRFAGKNMVRQWTKQNSHYLSYLGKSPGAVLSSASAG
jgi:radical SAM superfamily enzyme YgiQ (UPF0313 family)